MTARLSCLLLIAGMSIARADTQSNEATAQALFEAGRALIDAGRIDEACDKFVESQQLDPQVGTKLNIADCRIRQARLVEAYELFVEAKGEPRASAYHVNYAGKKIQELEAKLVRVTIVAADADASVQLGTADKLDPRPRRGWDHIVVAPGKLVIVASAPGRKSYRHEQAVEAGQTVTVAVPLLEVETRRRFGTPVILATVGGGLMVVSAALGLHAKSRYDTAVGAVDQAGVDGAQTEADVATGFLVVGAITATVGLVIHVKSRRSRLSIAPATDGSVGIVFGGRY